MNSDKALEVQEGNTIDTWGDREEIEAIAKRLKVMLPNGQNLTNEQAYAAAQYAKLSGLDPFASGFFAMPGGGITQHYAILVNWAQQKAPYSDKYMPLSAEERETEGITGDDTIAWKCYVLKRDDAPTLGIYLTAGMPFTEALDFVAARGIGFVTANDRKNKYGKSIDPPKNWTWETVAKKRALRQALSLSHGKPSVDELRQIAKKMTPEGRMGELAEQYAAVAEQSVGMTTKQHKERLEENASLLRGEPANDDYIDGESEPIDPWDSFCDAIIESDDKIPHFETPEQIRAAIIELDIEFEAGKEEEIYNALDRYANEKADKKSAEKEQATLE